MRLRDYLNSILSRSLLQPGCPMYNTSSDHMNCLTAFNSCDVSTSVEKQRFFALLMINTKKQLAGKGDFVRVYMYRPLQKVSCVTTHTSPTSQTSFGETSRKRRNKRPSYVQKTLACTPNQKVQIVPRKTNTVPTKTSPSV